jgi:hypothetical protein
MENNKHSEEVEIIIIDIEIFTKEQRHVPNGPHYHYLILIDRQKYEVDKPSLTGREILTLAGKVPPERFQLNQRFRGGKVRKVGLDEKVSFTEPGIEKFMTVPLDQTEGGL